MPILLDMWPISLLFTQISATHLLIHVSTNRPRRFLKKKYLVYLLAWCGLYFFAFLMKYPEPKSCLHSCINEFQLAVRINPCLHIQDHYQSVPDFKDIHF